MAYPAPVQAGQLVSRGLVIGGLAVALAVIGLRPVAARVASAPCPASLGTLQSCGGCGDVCGSTHAGAACVEGQCQLTCEPGFADCDGFAGNGCEVDLASDGAHCGLCSRSCGGGLCEAGSCTARFMGSGSAIVADEENVYAYRGEILRLSVAGAPESPLVDADGREDWRRAGASSMALNHENVFWSAAGRLRLSPLGDGPVQVLAAGFPAGSVIRLAGKSVVWIEETLGGERLVMRAPLEGGPAQIACRAPPASHGELLLATHARDVFVGDGHALYGLAVDAAEPVKLAVTGPVLGGLEADSEHVYWVRGRSDVGTAGSARGELVRVARDGGEPSVLAEARSKLPPVVDETRVFWADEEAGGGVIRRVNKEGGEVVVVGRHPRPLRGMAQSSTHLFWVDDRHRVFMLPKSRVAK